jgi:hypothetical protein
MKVIEIRPSERFRHHWEACGGDGVQPTFAGKLDAVDYATGRLGAGGGEIQVYSQDGSAVEDKVIVDDQISHPAV